MPRLLVAFPMHRSLIGIIVIGWLAGCVDPLYRTEEQQLRDDLIRSYERELRAVSEGRLVELSRQTSDVVEQLTPERLEELNANSGFDAYKDHVLEVGPNLLGQDESPTLKVSLKQAIELAVKHNLALQAARLTPAIRQTQVTAALADFDMIFFASADWAKTYNFQPNTFVPPVTLIPSKSDTTTLATGLTKRLASGGVATVQTQVQRPEITVAGSTIKYYETDLTLSLAQPLMRGFGTDVNRANIVLAQNARRADVQALRQTLIELCADVEAAYWRLVFAKQELLILTRLLERTIEDRDRLELRKPFDVNPVRITEANSFVELRRSDVIRARQNLRDASDLLKRLVNAPNMPVSDETLLLPLDRPADVPIEFSLLDAVTAAMRHRPELQIALLQIKDASIRQRVADNARLPLLDLNASINFNGVSLGNAPSAYDDVLEGNFVDYLVGGQFEVPIGNRGPEAQYAQRKLERRQSVVNYQDQSQLVALEVKNALRTLQTSYVLIGSTRAARLAAADSLRAIEVQEDAGVALTPEFLLDLKLNAQERLSNAETQEIQSLTDYSTSIAQLYRSMGTLLTRYGIAFDDMEAYPE